MGVKGVTAAAPAVMAAAIAVLAALAAARNHAWIDSMSLWRDAAAKSPHVARVWVNLSSEFMKAGRCDEALVAGKAALEADPRYIEIHFNMGSCYVKTGDYKRAIDEFNETLRIIDVILKGHYGQTLDVSILAGTRFFLGNAYLATGDYALAVGQYVEALKIAPKDAAMRFNLATAYRKLGKTEMAARELEEILVIDPADEEARWNLSALKGRR